MMGDPLGSSCVSSKKQNHEGVVKAQSRQYRATVEPELGCDNLVSEPITGRKCAYENVGPLRGGGLLDPTSPRGVDPLYLKCTYSSPYNTRPFGSSDRVRAIPGWVTH
ncbi:hypothetical protein EV1_028837 [Malus domestica]